MNYKNNIEYIIESPECSIEIPSELIRNEMKLESYKKESESKKCDCISIMSPSHEEKSIVHKKCCLDYFIELDGVGKEFVHYYRG